MLPIDFENWLGDSPLVVPSPQCIHSCLCFVCSCICIVLILLLILLLLLLLRGYECNNSYLVTRSSNCEAIRNSTRTFTDTALSLWTPKGKIWKLWGVSPTSIEPMILKVRNYRIKVHALNLFIFNTFF